MAFKILAVLNIVFLEMVQIIGISVNGILYLAKGVECAFLKMPLDAFFIST